MFLALAACLVLSLVRKGRVGRRVWWLRTVVIILCSAILAIWFVRRSTTQFVPESLAVQIINKLPQPLDFYIVKKSGSAKSASSYSTQHIGTIRPDYYRLEYLQMSDSDEFWVAGYLGKKNMVYFSQHYIPNKNIDPIIEVQNYLVQSQKLAKQAENQIKSFISSNGSLAVWITLCLLLLFMNVVLLFRGVDSRV